MVRKLPLVLAVTAALSPINVAALGLGEIHPKSALNQEFKADIELLSVKQGELDDVKVNLASTEAFTRAGVERPFLLSRLRFNPKRKADGSAVIEVTSRQPIREPFLNFLVEVNWPKGRLVREYTVLLDPPATLERAPAPVDAPAYNMGTTQRSASSGAETSFRGALQPAPPFARTVSEYLTKRNDTLWQIAKSLKSDQASVEQMIMALWRDNPHAFFKNNVNNLKVGEILRVPTDEQVLGTSRAQARRDFLAQASAWKAQRQATPPAVAEAPPPAAVEPPPAAVEFSGQISESAESTTVPDSELKLATAPTVTEAQPAPVEETGDSEQVVELKNQLLLAQEVGESARQESDELKSRVEQLEAQLEDIKRLVELKNDQLAQLQAVVTQQSEVPGQSVDDTAQPAVAEASGPELTGVGESTTVEASSDSADEVQKTAASTQNLYDKIKDNAAYLGAGAAGVVMLLGLIGLAVKRRKGAEAGTQESILVEDETVGATQDLVETSAPKSELSEDISFLSDFTPSDIDAYQEDTGEVDPLSEADVYMAYGRYQQAEELLRQAIGQDPQRMELKHKLAEVAYAKKDAEAFASVATELDSAGASRNNPKAWQKILVMGSELLPDNELFAGTENIEISQADTGDADVELGAAGDDDAPSTAGKAATAGLDFELDLAVDSDLAGRETGEFDENDLFGQAGGETSDADKLGLDLNIDELNELESALKDDTDNTTISKELTTEFDLEDLAGSGTDDQEMPELVLGESAQQNGLADIDLGDLDLGEKRNAKGDARSEIELDASALHDEVDFLASVDELEPTMNVGEQMVGDEVTTKLDLARAYVDMGDAEGARSILDEVLSEGNDTQKQEASVLLENLG